MKETLDFVSALSELKGLHIEGIFTHFPSADEDDMSFTHQQIADFTKLCKKIDASGIHIPLRHTANSAAILNAPDSYMNMVRPGIMLYGHCDFEPLCPPVELRPAFTLKSKVVFLKTLPAGCTVSYGRRNRNRHCTDWICRWIQPATF
jgi:alanine racemase